MKLISPDILYILLWLVWKTTLCLLFNLHETRFEFHYFRLNIRLVCVAPILTNYTFYAFLFSTICIINTFKVSILLVIIIKNGRLNININLKYSRVILHSIFYTNTFLQHGGSFTQLSQIVFSETYEFHHAAVVVIQSLWMILVITVFISVITSWLQSYKILVFTKIGLISRL